MSCEAVEWGGGGGGGGVLAESDLGGDRGEGKQVLERTDHSLRACLSRVGCKTRKGPCGEFRSER